MADQMLPGGTEDVPMTVKELGPIADQSVYFERGGKGGTMTFASFVESKDFQDLHPVFQRRLIDMLMDNPNIGIGMGGAGRPFKRQVTLFKQRYEPIKDLDWQDPDNYERIKQGKFKQYEGKWYRLKPGNAPVATPGSSYHGAGLAVDLVFKTSADRNWLLQNAESYGLRNIPGIGEPWHYQLAEYPDAMRMLGKLQETYDWNPLTQPLPKNVLEYLNNVASNAPFRPEDLAFIENNVKLKKKFDFQTAIPTINSYPKPKVEENVMTTNFKPKAR